MRHTSIAAAILISASQGQYQQDIEERKAETRRLQKQIDDDHAESYRHLFGN